MINKILIANRGEIALRIIRACKELDISTVAIYSTADELSLHVKYADEAVCIGPPASSRSYLKKSQIISAAEVTNADAIHPGYGFFAENADFAEMCEAHEIEFIGPSSEVINAMGNKARARNKMKEVNVPVIPGSEGIVENYQDLQKIAGDIGYPLLLKASAGGGGRGMRIVQDKQGLKSAYDAARSEAEAAFGDPAMYLERMILEAKHIELQIMGDKHGNVVHLGERDCSIQRRHQKMIEESPSPVVDKKLREKMGQKAVDAAKAVNYVGPGTVEFLLDKDNNFYFIEMNTRIQVEHPVTEMVTGYDIVRGQIEVANGKKLPGWLKNIKLRGHSVECRINAEDPEHNFRPCPGKINSFHMPGGPGIRMDTHIYDGYRMPPNYDSLLGKLITHGRTREAAIKRMERALDEIVIEGVHTIIPLHKSIIKNTKFQDGNFHTGFMDTFKYKKNKKRGGK
ncbi:MAG: acetyl-CoA carboxylase biotin carboxylase subunit [Candidatus Marinimicrobia bacterium]|nr:acetyl-CoA carboxylase biotin carboxylase subunit [Candidatus Neomarinimicrobiota bacterium]